MDEISQTEMYRAGTYREQILTAVRRRDEIETVMARYRTKAAAAAPESEEEAAAMADSVANDDESGLTGLGATDDLARFPFKPYCRDCGRDTTIITAYDDDTTDLSYTCTACSYDGVTNLSKDNEGKLVWKVDWPMRWEFEGVDFEPGGVDHASPGSSYTVGKELVKLYGGRAPSFVGYSFVGAGGQVKMSSSRGGVPTAADALQILEAPILRWLYVRRAPKQAFNVDFGAEVVRLYDEWDALGKKAADASKRDAQVLAFERASSTTSAGTLPTPAVVVPFRLLSSVADVTAGSADLISRIVGDVGHEHASVADLEPRLDKAMTWTADYVPAEDRTTVRETPDTARLAALNEDEELWLRQLLDRMADHLELESTTSLIYGVPKLARGLGLDDAPTDQVKQDQKAFFKLLYNLLVDADRGPRLPTLFLALGADKVRAAADAAGLTPRWSTGWSRRSSPDPCPSDMSARAPYHRRMSTRPDLTALDLLVRVAESGSLGAAARGDRDGAAQRQQGIEPPRAPARALAAGAHTWRFLPHHRGRGRGRLGARGPRRRRPRHDRRSLAGRGSGRAPRVWRRA